MARPVLASDEEISRFIQSNPQWLLRDKTLVRELVASNFVSAVGAINSIAVIAEKMDHHPDISLYGWNKIRITTTTHDRGGLTELDFTLASHIDDLSFNHSL